MRRREHFRINRWARTYDRSTGKFTINVAYETATEITPRTIAVSEAFGLGVDQSQKFIIYDNVELKIGPRDIVYITGDSGSGKSVLLRQMKKDLGDDVVDVADIQVDLDKPLIDTVGKTLEEGLELLSRVGLNDAFLFVRRFKELSDGQKYRYRIAKLIESEKQWWILDEFCATLDRDTAKIVAFNLQKQARKYGRAVVTATTHLDLFDDLRPSVHVHKRFGKEITVDYYPNEPASECSLVREMFVVKGSRQDYFQLADFHYRSHNITSTRKIFCLKRGEELCAVIVYAYPPAACFGRRAVLPKMSMQELNRTLSIISRVVVHPKYRTIGLGHKLVAATLERTGIPYLESSAVMAKYNPFFERAGMRKIIESPPSKQALKVAKTLQSLGFNTVFLRSSEYVKRKLSALKPAELNELRKAFAENKHPRFMKEFSSHMPYGQGEFYAKTVESADADKLTKLVGVCGMLLQAKVYLFWKNEPALNFVEFLQNSL